jgi:integrase/recombinase XerD
MRSWSIPLPSMCGDPWWQNESPTLGLSHLQFEALLTVARDSQNRFDFALIAMLGLLGLRIFEACHCDIADVGEEHGHRVLRVVGKGSKVALVPLPPAVGRAIDRAIGDRECGPILLNRRTHRMDRHCATRRLRRLAEASVVRLPRMHPHMLRHTYVTTMQKMGRIASDASFSGLCERRLRGVRGQRGTGEHRVPVWRHAV